MRRLLLPLLPRSVVTGVRSLAGRDALSHKVQSPTAAQQLDDLIARTGDWRHPDKTEDALSLARALVAHKRLPDALGVLENVSNPDACEQRARIHLNLGDASSAAIALAQGADGLSVPRVMALEIGICALRQGDLAACVLAEQAVSQHPDDTALQDIWLGLLADTDLQGDVFAATIATYLSGQKLYASRWRLFVETAIRRNCGIWVLPQLLTRIAQTPKDGFALQSAIEIAWKAQDSALLTRLIEGAAALPQVPYKLAKQAAERADVFPPFADIAELVHAQTEPLSHGLGDAPLARLGGLAGRVEAALAVVNTLLVQRPYLVNARFVRAELRDIMGDHAGALADVQNLMEAAPQMPAPYGLAFTLMSRQSAPEPKLTALLDRRARYVKRFRPDPVTGRVPLDMLRYQTALARDDRAAAAAARATRPARRLLHSYVGTDDSGPKVQMLGSGHMCERIGVIAWLGIGDEVRWAQTYGLLLQLARQATVSCEPRMQSLLKRSFPDIKFVPVRRRWPLRWQARPVLRSDIRDIGLSAYVNGALLRQFAGSDAVFFPEEIVAQLLQHAPSVWDNYVGGLMDGYLRPDPIVCDHWRRQLKAAGRPVVGLIWRSGLISPQRQPHYMTLQEMIPVLKGQSVDAVALVPHLTDEEVNLCQTHGITVPQDLDFDDDIEGIAALVGAVDLVVGISALPFELAAGVGTPTWAMVLTPDAVARRCRMDDPSYDQMTLNGRVIVPAGGFDFTDRAALIADTVAMAQDQLQRWLAAAD